jgi:Protein of unknown function (DUF2846)
MFKHLSAAIVVASVLIAGCASAPMASNEQDVRAKTFAPTAGTSNIYIYRNESMGAAMSMDVAVDGKAIGKTVAKSYFVIPVAPGKHTVTSRAETDSSVDFTTEPSKNYFVWQEVKMGMLSARSQLHLMGDAEGRAGVSECKMLATTP